MLNRYPFITPLVFSVFSGIIPVNSALGDESSIENITVYGTTNALPVFDYPGQVSVLGREDIELFNPSTISELLRDVPGVEFSGGPRRTGETPSIRGRGGENILILLDGARQSFISAHDGRFFLDPELISLAEVVKGPASSLYGSGAVGGVLAFETLNARDLLKKGEHAGYKIRVGYQGVNDESSGSVTGFVQSGKFDLLGNLAFRQSGPITLGTGAELSSDDEIATGLLKLEYRPNDDWVFDTSWQRLSSQAIEPNNGQGLNQSDNDVNKDIETDNVRIGLNFAPEDNLLINTQATLYTSQSSVSEFDVSLPRTTLRDIETKGLSLRNSSLIEFEDTSLQFTVGIDWYQDKQRGRDDNTSDGLRGGVPNGKAEFTGLFVQAQANLPAPLGLPGELLIVPGIRFDRYTSDAGDISPIQHDDNASSPRLAMSYHPTSWLGVFANYSEGFRAPSINELFLDGVHFSIPHPTLFNPGNNQFVFVNNNFIANPDLQAEESDSKEVGLSFNFVGVLTGQDSLQAKMSYYQSDIENLIDLNVNFGFDAGCFAPPFQPCSAGTSNSINVNQAEMDGVEIQAEYSSKQFDFSLGYNAINGTNKQDGSDLGLLTPDRLTFDLRWKLPQYKTQLGARWQLANRFERQALNTQNAALQTVETRSGYGVLDIYAQWQSKYLDGVGINFGIDNIFDKAYERVFEGVTAKGRNLKLNVHYRGKF